MGKYLLGLIALIVLAGAAMYVWRLIELRQERSLRAILLDQARATPSYDPAMLLDQDPHVQHFFDAVFAPGAPLSPVVTVDMTGDFGLGTFDDPGYRPMTARQTIAFPHGFLWQASLRGDEIGISGADSLLGNSSSTRFWLTDVLPVARAGGTEDRARSAQARLIADALIWSPAALMPSDTVVWSAQSATRLQLEVRMTNGPVTLDITLNDAGLPIELSFDRWTDANPDKVFRLQRFGGTMSDHRTFEGVTLPTHVEAGNFFGSDEYFPFFVARVQGITFGGTP